MKRFMVPVIAIYCLANAGEAAARHSAGHRAAAKGLFAAMNMQKTMDEVIVGQIDMQIKTKPMIAPFREVMLKFMRKYMGWKTLEGEMAILYMDAFSKKELIGLTRFYRTALGRKTIRMLPTLAAKGAALGQQKVQQNQGELQSMLQAAARSNGLK